MSPSPFGLRYRSLDPNPPPGFFGESDAALSPRRATYFSLLRQRNLRKRKASRSQGPCASLRGSLRCSSGAEILETSPLRGRRTSKIFTRPSLRCSALPHGVKMGSGAGSDADAGSGVFGVRARIRHAFGAPCGCCAAKLRSDPKNQAARQSLKHFRSLAAVIRA